MADTSVSFDASDRARVNQAVRQAESTTGAEIVPVVARCSGRYDRGEDVLGLWAAALVMILVWWLYPLPGDNVGNWNEPSPIWQIVALLIGGLIGFLVGAFVGSRVAWARRLFTPATQMRDEVDRRAREVFYDQRVHHAASGAGVLLYVSLFEQRAAVIADRAVLERLGQPQIDELCDGLTRRLHDSNIIDALCDTVLLAAERLATAVPREREDQNELADALVVID